MSFEETGRMAARRGRSRWQWHFSPCPTIPVAFMTTAEEIDRRQSSVFQQRYAEMEGKVY